MNSKNIKIDSSKGGNGDIWMRLISFYAVANLLPEYKFIIKIPPFFKQLAVSTFSERLDILTDEVSNTGFLQYTNLGIKDLIMPVLSGNRFISPYQKAVIHDKKQKQLKDSINNVIFDFLNLVGLVLVPDKKWILHYQGFLDIIAIKQIRRIGYKKFLEQLNIDAIFFLKKLSTNLPISKELIIPNGLNNSVLVFPNGTSRQFVPLWWASKYLPDAYYAFFVKDTDSIEFEMAGLKVIYFYKELGDIIYLSQNAKWTISTDSFPSHLLQYSSKTTTILLTEVLKSRIVSPVFKGRVVDSVAPCHPCLHKARKVQPLCDAGYEECINWKSDIYTSEILQSIKEPAVY